MLSSGALLLPLAMVALTCAGRERGRFTDRGAMTTDELLAQLRGSKTDLGRFVEAMLREQLPNLVVPAQAVRAWQEREPQTWAMVCDWLAAQGKSVVLV